MIEIWTQLSDIPADGRDFSFTDQALWHEAWKEFKLPVKPDADLVATAHILPQGKGALVRGTLKGSVILHCDRCAAEFALDVDVTFDVYEELPDEEYDEVPRVREENGELEIDMGGILWEEFVLALPVKPLCNDGCKGICSGCGKDLNTDSCECEQEEGDPRLAVFRNLKVK